MPPPGPNGSSLALTEEIVRRFLNLCQLLGISAACGLWSLTGPAAIAIEEESIGYVVATDEETGEVLPVSYNRPRCCVPCPTYTVPELQDQPMVDQAAPMAPPEEALMPGQYAATDTGTFALMDSNVGYVDSAIPWSQVRIRYDAAYFNPFPDRAEFFYAKCGCFRNPQLQTQGTFDPDAKGPTTPRFDPESSVDYQDLSIYVETALSARFSVFAELPIRFLNPDINDNTSGISDIISGAKYAVYADPDQYLTFQVKVYAPTGDSFRGLGTAHVSVEPGILYYGRLTQRLRIEGEVREWLALGGSDFAGNVLRYGGGIGYDLFTDYCGDRRFTPIVEAVGWTVLDGARSTVDPLQPIVDASGETIVNIKAGARLTSGANSVYAGWGHGLTDDIWYRDIFRFEFRHVF
jgi:hypothetical protein